MTRTGDPFRDTAEAALARVQQLEQENAELRARIVELGGENRDAVIAARLARLAELETRCRELEDETRALHAKLARAASEERKRHFEPWGSLGEIAKRLIDRFNRPSE